MNSFNPKLAEVALENLIRLGDGDVEKSAVIPADAVGPAPVEPIPQQMGGMPPGGMPPGGGGMPPGGELPPELAGAMGGGAPPPEAGGMPPEGGGGPPGGAPPDGQAPIGEQIASLNGKMDQLLGHMQGFMAAVQQIGAGGSGGSKGGGQNEVKDMLTQMMTQMGIQPQMGGGAPGQPPMAPAPSGVGGIGGSQDVPIMGPPGSGGPPGGGMTPMASDQSRSNGTPADKISRIFRARR